MKNLIQKKFKTILRDRDFRELISGSGSAIILKIIGVLVGYLFNLLVIRWLGVSAWGSFVLALACMSLASIFARGGLDTVSLRLIAALHDIDSKRRVSNIVKRALGICITLSLMFSLILFFLSNSIATIVFSKPEIGIHIQIGAIGVPGLAITLLSSQALRGLRRIKEYVFFDLIARFLFALLLFPLIAILIQTDISVITSFVISVTIVAILNLVLLFRRIERLGIESKNFEEVPYKEDVINMTKLGVPLLLASSVIFLNGWVDTLILGRLVDQASVGIYHVAYKIAALTSMPLLAVKTIAAPKVSTAGSVNSNLKKIVNRAGIMILLPSALIAIILILSGSWVLGIFGSELKSGVLALNILIIGSFFNAVMGLGSVVLQMVGKLVSYQNLTIGVLFIKVLLTLILVPQFGIEGAALSSAISSIMWGGGCVLLVKYQKGFWPLAWLSKLN